MYLIYETTILNDNIGIAASNMIVLFSLNKSILLIIHCTVYLNKIRESIVKISQELNKFNSDCLCFIFLSQLMIWIYMYVQVQKSNPPGQNPIQVNAS